MPRRTVDQRVGALSAPPTLELPGPAAELWGRTRDVVRGAVASLGTSPLQYCIGGGTILAARWQHRESFDIDLTLPRDAPLGRLRADQGDPSRFEARLKVLGGKAQYYPDQKFWRVAFDDGKQGLDIWAHDSEIAAGEEQRTVQGRVETVLSSAQILRGKFERADRRLVRDVFDTVKAAAEEPGALESAVNAVSVRTAGLIASNWHWSSPEIAEAALLQLRGMPDDEQVAPAELGNAAAKAILAAVYTHCRIETRNGAIEVTTATKNRKPHTRRIAARDAETVFEASGLNGYLETAGPGARDLREYSMAECGRGRDVLILNVELDSPVQWRTESAGGNLAPGSALRADRRDRPPQDRRQSRENRRR